jgi:hypothetical protein
MTQVTVKEGDCVLSLAAQAGLFWETVWSDPANQKLAAKRRRPNILMPGDSVEVADLTTGHTEGGSESRHTFSLKGVPARLRLRLLIRGEPVSEKKITLVVDGTPIAKTTDANGRIDVAISPQAAEAKLQIEGDKGTYLLKLGWMTPVDETSGLQARLFNLGFDPKGIDNDFGSNTRKAMQAFQKAQGMKTTEKPNAETREALEKEYGC